MMRFFQDILANFKPRFWDTRAFASQDEILFNYKRFWLLFVFLSVMGSLVPMSILFIFSYKLEHKAIRNEDLLRTTRLISNTTRTVTFFLEERLDALRFVIKEKKLEDLNDLDELSNILQNLKIGFGAFVDLGIIDSSGVQINYAGDFDLKGKLYNDQEWFKGCVESGSYVSDIFLGYRGIPHMIIALKWPQNASNYIIRATLDIEKFTQILSSLEIGERSDIFLCNRKGILQTPSKYYGKLLQKTGIPIP
ncbi:MAG: cache domain-containing protein, partial [Pseudomonadota bacterium]